MGAPGARPDRLSLLEITVRRSFYVGRYSLIVGTAMSILYSAGLGLASGDSYATFGPLILPIFAVSGGTGGLLVFSNDRTKGVLEYLVAYGASPRQLLRNVLLSGLVQVSVVLGLATSAGLAAYLGTGHPLSAALFRGLLGYGIPMAYATVGLMTAIGVFWTSLSAPRSGMNSPLGLVPILGVVPSTTTLIFALLAGPYAAYVMGAAVGLVAGALVVLLALTNRLMPAERLLSPA